MLSSGWMIGSNAIGCMALGQKKGHQVIFLWADHPKKDHLLSCRISFSECWVEILQFEKKREAAAYIRGLKKQGWTEIK